MGAWLPKSFATRLSLGMAATCFGSLMVIAGFHLWYAYQQSVESKNSELTHRVVTLTADITSRIDALRRDLHFLASLESVNTIISESRRADNPTSEGSSPAMTEAKDRLAGIFEELLLANEEYVQARLIGVADQGRELVRVDWKDRQIQRTPEAALQAKGAEPYFKAAQGAPAQKVYLSEFSLNREWGKIEQPPRLVIRAAVPLTDANQQVFGMVVVNMQAEQVLAELLDRHQLDQMAAIYDSQLHPLVTSSKSGVWEPSDQEDQVKQDMLKLLRSVDREHSINRKKIAGNVVVVRKIFYDPMAPDRFLGVTLTTPMEQIYQAVWLEFAWQMVLVLAVTMVVLLLAIVATRHQTKPLQHLRQLTADLKAGKHVPPPVLARVVEDELSELTRDFYQMAEEVHHKTSMLNIQKTALDATALVSETDRRGAITYANEQFVIRSGYAREELLGQNHRIVNSGYHSHEFFTGLWKTIANGETWRGEIQNRAKDGTTYWVDTAIVPIRNRAGQIDRYMSVRFDITEKKEREQQVKELTEAKSRFLAVMSHEIRTPLGAVIGLNELLAGTQLNGEQAGYVNNIGHSADLLLKIVNDILDLTKLDAGKLEIHPEPTMTSELGESMLHIFQEKSQEKGVSLRCHYSAALPQAIRIDAPRVKQILMNLISNALKFTHQGSVTLDFDFKESGQQLIIRVGDTGIGMSTEQLSRVFNEFEQAESGTAKKFGGTGLGLPIVKKTVLAMGGTITSASVVGQGSQFLLHLPAEPCIEEEARRSTRAAAPQDLHLDPKTSILLAEDYPLNQTIFGKMFQSLGLHIRAADDGLAAVQAYQKKTI